jgi:hypothetical protein
VFDIAGPGPHAIQPASPLPLLSSPMLIDGYSQPGAAPNTVDALRGYDADIRIRLDGSGGGSFTGLWIEGEDAVEVEIRGLELANFPGTAILVRNATRDVVIAGVQVRDGNGFGIATNAFGATANLRLRIGGPEAADRNLVHGQIADAIGLGHCIECVVENNWVGLRAQAGLPVAAANASGILVSTGSIDTQIRDNWVGRNQQAGILVDGLVSGTVLGNNLIGSGFANTWGVLVVNNHGLYPLDTLIEDNIIVGNGTGVAIASSIAGNTVVGHVLRGNRILASSALPVDLGSDGGGVVGLGSVNGNDPGDLDQGPNGGQNHPLLGTPVQAGMVLQLPWQLDSGNGPFEIEFAFSSSCDGSGHGPDGAMPTPPARISAVGNAGTAELAPVDAPATGFVSATATGGFGTSEYSACVPYSYSVPAGIFADGFEDG